MRGALFALCHGRPRPGPSPAVSDNASLCRLCSSFRLHWREGAHFLAVEDRDFIVGTINRELTA